jgi:hypothetical protein
MLYSFGRCIDPINFGIVGSSLPCHHPPLCYCMSSIVGTMRRQHNEGDNRAFSHRFFLSSHHEEEEGPFLPAAHCYLWIPLHGLGWISTWAQWCGAGVPAVGVIA